MQQVAVTGPRGWRRTDVDENMNLFSTFYHYHTPTYTTIINIIIQNTTRVDTVTLFFFFLFPFLVLISVKLNFSLVRN